MAALERFHFHVAEEPPEAQGPRRRGARSAPPPDRDEAPGFANDEAAARFHLSRLLQADRRPGVRGVTGPGRPERVPDLRLVRTDSLPATETRLVRFEQTRDEIPIFGAQAVCELTDQRGFVSALGQVGRVEGVSSKPSLSNDEALQSIADLTELDDPSVLDEVKPGRLHFFADSEGTWHLVFLFEGVPAAPPGFTARARGHGTTGSPRLRRPRLDYLVDAHTGDVVFYFSATPMLDVPVRGSGVNEDGADETVWGQMAGAEFELDDPQRSIRTHDLAGGDIDRDPPSEEPYRAASSTLGSTAKAIVSAHANATRVYDFLRGVLGRESIDNAGMDIVNIVNVTSAADEKPPAWRNAIWWENRMWYGQFPGPSPGAPMVSFARFLDIIAHELTHGVTAHTAQLVYQDQAGALDESISDIFGVMVKNWDHAADGGDVARWDWEIGSGLGSNGLPLRDLSDPGRTGDPAHMDDYMDTDEDYGGVHTNSNIHNKAAHNLLTAVGPDGELAFTPRDVAVLYYHALLRLGRMDGFEEMLAALLDVADTMYAGDAQKRAEKVASIRQAYSAVGIT